MWAHENVIACLFRRALVSEEDVVRGNLTVLGIPRRNHNFKVLRRGRPGYLIKQGVGPDRAVTVAHEARVYRLLRAKSYGDRVQHYLPRLYGYDTRSHVLILELLAGAETLREHYVRCGRCPVHVGAALGHALGALHRLPPSHLGAEFRQTAGRRPWVLGCHRPTLGLLQAVSAPHVEIVKTVQRHHAFCAALDRLAREWQPLTVIHFDVSLDNCLVPTRSARGWQLKLIDWELAAVGDPSWDVGSAFSSYLAFWLLSIPMPGTVPPDRAVLLAQHLLAPMQPAIRAFWRSYAAQRRFGGPEARECLLRAVQYCGARLVQTAFEELEVTSDVTGAIVWLLQLSLNVMQRPEIAAAHLLGIDPDGVT